MGFGEQGRRYRGGHSVNSVSVGRRDDRIVWDRVLGIREVDRPERVAIRREEGDAGAHVHGWRRVLSRESVRPLGLSVQERRRARTDFGSVHRDHVRMASRAALDHRREIFYWLAFGLRRDDVFCSERKALLPGHHLLGYPGTRE